MGHKNRPKENGAAEDMLGRCIQEGNRRTVVTRSPKPGRMGYTHTASVKATSLGIAHLVIKHSSSPGFYQEAVTFMGLIRLIYLFSVCNNYICTYVYVYRLK
jgi:hypothetical protein